MESLGIDDSAMCDGNHQNEVTDVNCRNSIVMSCYDSVANSLHCILLIQCFRLSLVIIFYSIYCMQLTRLLKNYETEEGPDPYDVGWVLQPFTHPIQLLYMSFTLVETRTL